MRKNLAISLMAIFSLSLSIGCADGKSKKRERLTSHSTLKTQPADDSKKSKTDEASGSESGVEAETTPPAETTAPSDESKYDESKANIMIKDFEDLKIKDGTKIELADLAKSNLVLQEIVLGFSVPVTQEEAGFLAFSYYEIKEETAGELSLVRTEAGSTGIIKDINLDTLQSDNRITFDETGKPAQRSQMSLAPQIKDQKLTLDDKEDDLSARPALGSVFDQLLVSNDEESDTEISSTVEMRKTEDTVQILIEKTIEGQSTQTFLLKFKIEKELAK